MRQAKRLLSVPAIKLPSGRVVKGKRGDIHKDIIERLHNKPKGNIQHGFIDKGGNYLSRPDARNAILRHTGRSVGTGRPDSGDLMKKKPKTKAGKMEKMEKVMHEFKTGKLASGSKEGPKVKSRAQAIAIGLKQSGQSKYDKKPAKRKKRKSVGEALSS